METLDKFLGLLIQGGISFSHLFMVLNNRKWSHMNVQQAGCHDSTCKFNVVVCCLTHTSLSNCVFEVQLQSTGLGKTEEK